MMNRLIFETNDALLTALGYVNAAKLILRAMQSETRGEFIDTGLYSLELVIGGVEDMVKDARGSVEDMNIITPADEPVDRGEQSND